MSRLVDIGITVRSTENNPWFERLIRSLESIEPGIPAEVYIESAPELTKVEKRVRLFRQSKARMLCILEDDTEILHTNWLAEMVAQMTILDRMAILNPQETRQSLSEESATELLVNEVQELTNVGGFCMLVDRESGVEPDVRVQTMDDLWMSLAARAKGWRIGRSKGSLVRHSKAPWADDNLPPDQQVDRSRFGEGHSYYDAGKHEAKQRLEARLMVEVFGDLARLTLPTRLLPWADPLHPDFGMAWDHGRPVNYSAQVLSSLKKSNGNVSETMKIRAEI